MIGLARKTPKQILATFALPMALSQWTQVPLPKREFPKFAQAAQSWKMTTQKSAGGYVYLFDQPQAVQDPDQLMAEWKWGVRQFPDARPKVPFTKESDDYAVRVGFLFDDQQSHMKLPPDIQAVISKRKLSLSYVIFYGAARPGERENCGVSPYSDRIWMCLRTANATQSTVSAKVAHDLRTAFKLGPVELSHLQLIGVWVVADSDNSSSRSESELSSITLKGDP